MCGEWLVELNPIRFDVRDDNFLIITDIIIKGLVLKYVTRKRW